MESYSQEQFDQMPEFMQGEYTKQEDGTYKHGASLKLKGTLNDLDGKNKSLQSQFDEIKEQMNTFESKKAEEIQAAKDEALSKAKTSGDIEAIEAQYNEKMQDLEKRVEERTRATVESEFTIKQAKTALTSDIKLLASELAIDEHAKASLEVLIAQRAKLDENGKRGYFGEDGSALSITELKAFGDELKRSTSLQRLIKGETPSNGGFAQGGQPASGAEGQPAKSKATQGYLANLKN